METNAKYIKRIAEEQMNKANNSKFKYNCFSVCDEPFKGTFYKGSKGGIYYWKTSKKTGKQYKAYISSGSKSVK